MLCTAILLIPLLLALTAANTNFYCQLPSICICFLFEYSVRCANVAQLPYCFHLLTATLPFAFACFYFAVHHRSLLLSATRYARASRTSFNLNFAKNGLGFYRK
ncbi:hypothetical protein LJC08_02325 [Methanimicrococcus sp. OttesenSCG-928-J09]|nr:hypothetical protein [Methanimicrococcus sp. OttesenSCG-928-J09]